MSDVTDFTTTVFTDSASDAMQVLGVGELPSPAACIVCGNGTYDGGYLFFGIHIDFLGALLLCGRCLLQGGEKFGLMSPDVAKRIHEQAVELAEEVVILRRENEANRVRLAVFDDALRSVVSDPIANHVDTDVVLSEVNASSELPTKTAQSDNADGTAEPDKSTADDGLPEPATVASIDITAQPRRPTKSSGPNL